MKGKTKNGIIEEIKNGKRRKAWIPSSEFDGQKQSGQRKALTRGPKEARGNGIDIKIECFATGVSIFVRWISWATARMMFRSELSRA